MKMLNFMEIGTQATADDFDMEIETLIHIPIDSTSTMKDVFNKLVDETVGDDYAILALEKFISVQDSDSFEKNIFAEENIELSADDTNQYYMIFHLFNIKNIMENAVEKGEIC